MIPTLTTDRLTLGPFSMAHYEAFRDFAASERSRYLGGPSTDPRDAWESCMMHLGHWAARGYGGFFATARDSGAPAGRISIWHPVWLDEPELSWVIYDGHEGKGLAAEGARAVRDWAARRGLGPLMSLIDAGNAASIALARKLGATLEGEHTYDHGKSVQRWRHLPGATA